jgi:RimJ/RimL family protein N-acetyltransferase
MDEGWRFTPEQEKALWPLGEGQNVIKGEKLRLRLPTRDEVIAVYKATDFPITDREHFFETTVFSLTNKYDRLLFAHTLQSDEKIGSVTLSDEDKNGTLYFGIDVEPAFQDRGYGQEMVELSIDYVMEKYRALVDRLFIFVETHNARAMHIYEKAGYKTINTEMFTAKDGTVRQVHKMELLLPEAPPIVPRVKRTRR